jgi:hypothetical protein
VFPRLLDVLGDSEWNELFEAMIERREGVAAAA